MALEYLHSAPFVSIRHLLVLIQLMLTLGIPYMLIYVQIISPVMMLLILPIGIAMTAVFMFLLVAVIDDVSFALFLLLTFVSMFHLLWKTLPSSHTDDLKEELKLFNR